ncbi:MAG: acyl-CoA dehydrogenase family protein [Gammaproteobacteria bacterium]
MATAQTELPPGEGKVTGQYALTWEQQEILEQADRFAREKLHHLQERMDKEEWWPEGVLAECAELGYLGLTAPEKWGGADMDLFESMLVAQSFAKWNPAFALSWGTHENLCLNNILRNASEEQCDRYLPKLCRGEWTGALALTEPGAGSDALLGMRTTATRDGDNYILNGRKMYITNGSIADVILVYAKTSMEDGAKGISAFIVETTVSGFSVAQRLSKMGMRGSPTAELVFDDCVVPARNRVMAENEGVAVVMSGLDIERALVGPMCVGMAERALELSIDYARERKQFGKSIGSFQMIQAKLADMYAFLESMRAMAYATVSRCNDLERGAGGRGNIHKLTAATALHCATHCMKILDEAVQIHGGFGFMAETEVNRLYRAGKLLEIGAGTNEVRRVIIAEELLRG